MKFLLNNLYATVTFQSIQLSGISQYFQFRFTVDRPIVFGIRTAEFLNQAPDVTKFFQKGYELCNFLLMLHFSPIPLAD